MTCPEPGLVADHEHPLEHHHGDPAPDVFHAMINEGEPNLAPGDHP